jgi:hypothetical protein
LSDRARGPASLAEAGPLFRRRWSRRNLFRYDPTSGQYVFNWNTKGLTAGLYGLRIELGDGVTRTVNLGLK